jgi:hypothetical protein
MESPASFGFLGKGTSRLFTDGVTRPVYEDERGQFIVEDGERIDGTWLAPKKDGADTPVMVER